MTDSYNNKYFRFFQFENKRKTHQFTSNVYGYKSYEKELEYHRMYL